MMKAKSRGIFLLRVLGALISFAVLISGTLGSDSLPAAFYNFPPKQQLLAFLVETIDWYRLLSVEQQIATEPTDMLFLEDNRPIGVQVVRFSFDFARAAVAFEARTSAPADPKGQRNRASSGSDFQHLAVMESKSSAEAQQAANDLKSIKQKRHLSEQPTGRIVSFSNSFVFVSPATGLIKGMPGSAKTPGESSLRMADDHRCQWCLECDSAAQA
jgi:hypothetical protein